MEFDTRNNVELRQYRRLSAREAPSKTHGSTHALPCRPIPSPTCAAPVLQHAIYPHESTLTRI